ncbi:uncharacterized protein [Phaseolus vulgaris]|uniref:uncharacterized protein n=1 Tax=Phaseolus vulgaris TaxID=3885 RepID=UPI0035CB815A
MKDYVDCTVVREQWQQESAVPDIIGQQYEKTAINTSKPFTDKKLLEFYADLGIKSTTTSIEHPQTNGQAESANKVILSQLKRRLGSAKGLWAEKLHEILWAYRCTSQTSIEETPFNLTYGTDAMLPIEVSEPTLWRQIEDWSVNNECLKAELDLIEELREKAKIREEAVKRIACKRFNAKVKSLSREHFLIILSVQDAFTPGEIPPERTSTYNSFGLGCFHFR